MPSVIAKTITPQSSAKNWLRNNPCPPPGEGVHEWLKSAAGSLKKIGLTVDEAFQLIWDNATRKNAKEIQDILEFVYSSSSTGPATPRVEFGEYDPDLLAEYAFEVPEITQGWFASVSPVSVDSITPPEFFAAVFPGEQVFATTYPMSKGGFIYEGPHEAEELQRYLDGNQTGAWFLSNPVDGEWRGEGDAYSCRSEANLTSFRYIVLESDVAPVDQWLAMLVQQPLAIVALYRSGGKSVHALVRIKARNKAEFDRERDRLRVKYCPLGADPAAMSAVRLTRVPNVIRRDNFAYQRLIYLNPKPIARSIYQNETASA